MCVVPAGSGQFFPVSRELVFDIDLTDYDDVRTCGSGAHVCNRCWPLMAAAVEVRTLGVHIPSSLIACWVHAGHVLVERMPLSIVYVNTFGAMRHQRIQHAGHRCWTGA